MDSNTNIELLRGHKDTIILCTLMPGDKYGLEILKDIVDSSQELYTLKQPTLYSALKRLTAEGFIDSYEGDTSNGRKRVYYTLTDKGRKFVTDDQLEWEFSRTIIDKLVSDKVFDPVLNNRPFNPSEFRPSTKRATKAKPDGSDVDCQSDATPPVKNVNEHDLPCGVTSGAFNTTAYNESIIPKKSIEPIKVANTDKVEDKFYFSSVVSAELKNRELIEREEYCAKPTSIASLYDSKWEKPPVKSVVESAKPEPKRITASEKFSFDNIQKSDTHAIVIDETDRKAAESMLYAPQCPSGTTRNKSGLPESLTHYDLDIKPKSDIKIKNNDILLPKPTSLAPATSTAKYVDKQYVSEQNIILPSHTPAEEKSVNYISALANIFNSSTQQPQVVDRTKPDLYTYDQSVKASAKTATPSHTNNVYLEDMNLAKLKSKLHEEDITLKQYVKSETSNYYVNKYFYSNKILRDWSFISYAIFAIFCIISFVSTIKLPNSNLGAFLGIMFAGAVVPIIITIKWYVNKSARKSANFSFAHTMVTGAIVMLILLMAVLAISFFAVKINIADVKSLVAPLILPLIALLMIPLDITIFAALYNSKKYHLR